MDRASHGRVLQPLLALMLIAMIVATGYFIAEALEEREAATAATDLRLAVLTVAESSEPIGERTELDRDLFETSMAQLDGGYGAALHALDEADRAYAIDDLTMVASHGELIAGNVTPAEHDDGHHHLDGHGFVQHGPLLDLLRTSSLTAARNAARAERAAIGTAVVAALALLGLATLGARARASLVADSARAMAFRETAGRLGALLDAHGAVAVVAPNAAVSYASAGLRQLVPGAANASDLAALAGSSSRIRLHRHLTAAGVDNEELDVTTVLETAGGEPREFAFTVTDLRDDPMVGGNLVQILETTDDNRLRRNLEYMATHDQLTGLPNRRALTTALQSTSADHALLMIDLDSFKETNDTYGHDAGDRLLTAVGSRFAACLGRDETLYRLGGDEFAVLMRGSLDEARGLGFELLAALDDPIDLGDAFERASASVGVADQTSGDRSHSLLRRADIALYEAKSLGGGDVQVLTPQLTEHAVRTTTVGRALERADLDEEFHVVFQPIVDAGDGRIRHLEALARWTAPEHGPVRPDVFIPLAEASGRILEIGDWVMRSALEQLADWRRDGIAAEIGVTVNVSPFQLERDGFVERTHAVLRDLDLDPQDLTIEVTESAVVTRAGSVSAALHALRSIGCTIACDDFGSGFSNLGQLMRLPLDVIKVDRSLLTMLTEMRELMGGDPDQPCQVMSAISSIADAMGATVVAEGVEELQQAASLERSGVALLQGYLFSRPQPADALRADLERLATGQVLVALG